MTPILRLILIGSCACSAVSCYYPDYYDPNYTSSSGYVGSGITFVATSSSQWFYDSSVRCYYDRYRGCYYDPFLNGYYPKGYCPRPIRYAPHPYGWNGRGTCPPPRHIRSRQLDRHQDRIALIKKQNYSWAKNAREQTQANSPQWQKKRAKEAAEHAARSNRSRPHGGQSTSHSRTTVPERAPSGRVTQTRTRPQLDLHESTQRNSRNRTTQDSSMRSSGSTRLSPNLRPSPTRETRNNPDVRSNNSAPNRPSPSGYNRPVTTKKQTQTTTPANKRGRHPYTYDNRASPQNARNRR